MNKILITIQGRTLILYYQVKRGLPGKNLARASTSVQTAYIEVSPTAELTKFDLKGLTPEMFCVNISDMVNIRGIFSGQVENERQIAVARWVLNHEEYLQVMSAPSGQLSHQQIIGLLAPLPGFIGESEHQYIDFEERLVPHGIGDHATFSGYRLTIATEEIEGKVSSYAYYSLDTLTPSGWQSIPPPPEDYQAIRSALEKKLQLIRDAGVEITKVYDETDYALLACE